MNQPHHPDTELDSLADEFDAVLHSLNTQNTAQHHLFEPLAAVAALAARLGSKVHDAHTALATCPPADRPSHAATATELCHAVGTAGRAVNALAAAQDAHLFIDHFADRHGHPAADTAFARTLIATALTKARDNLTETSSHLRRVTPVQPTAQLLRAARARSPHAPASGPDVSTSAGPPASAPAPMPMVPTAAKGR